MKSFDLNLLTALEALLATGSVTAAAERMHLSTPAMSHTLARIRTALGDPILVRAGQRLVPTARALALMEPLGRLLADAQQLLQPADAAGLAAVSRRFVVRVPDGVAVVHGATLAQELQQVMPHAALQLLPEGYVDPGALREGRIDLEVSSGPPPGPEIETLALREQRLMGAVRIGHPLLAGRFSLRRFAAERHVAVATRPHEALPIDAALAAAGLSRFVALTVPNHYAALYAAARSPLVASVPARVALGMCTVMGLSVFELPLQIASEPLRLAWHPRHNRDPAHAWLRECLQRLLTDTSWLTLPLVPQQPGAARPQASGLPARPAGRATRQKSRQKTPTLTD